MLNTLFYILYLNAFIFVYFVFILKYFLQQVFCIFKNFLNSFVTTQYKFKQRRTTNVSLLLKKTVNNSGLGYLLIEQMHMFSLVNRMLSAWY